MQDVTCDVVYYCQEQNALLWVRGHRWEGDRVDSPPSPPLHLAGQQHTIPVHRQHQTGVLLTCWQHQAGLCWHVDINIGQPSQLSSLCFNFSLRTTIPAMRLEYHFLPSHYISFLVLQILLWSNHPAVIDPIDEWKALNWQVKSIDRWVSLPSNNSAEWVCLCGAPALCHSHHTIVAWAWWLGSCWPVRTMLVLALICWGWRWALTSTRDVSSCVSGPVQVWRNLSRHGLSLSLRIHSVLPEKFCFLHIWSLVIH